MNVEIAIKTRRSVRRYKAEQIPEEKLLKVLEAARLAPSAHNKQAWKFIVVKNEQKRKEIAQAAGQSFIATSPVIIAGVALDTEEILRSGVPSYAVDLAIALDHLSLAAIEQGLGTCWVGAFSQEEVKKVLGLAKHHKVVALMPCGFPADEPCEKDRKDLSEIVEYI